MDGLDLIDRLDLINEGKRERRCEMKEGKMEGTKEEREEEKI